MIDEILLILVLLIVLFVISVICIINSWSHYGENKTAKNLERELENISEKEIMEMAEKRLSKMQDWKRRYYIKKWLEDNEDIIIEICKKHGLEKKDESRNLQR